MEKPKLIFLVIFLVFAMLPVSGCEKYTELDEINGLIRENDLSINIKVRDDSDCFTIEKIYESSDDYCLKIDFADTYSLRGETTIKPGNKYKLFFTLTNIDADPFYNYSF